MSSEWNWLEWVHHTSKDMSVHTATSYQEAVTALLNASSVLAEAWAEGYGAGRDDEAECRELKNSSPNPYSEDS